MAASSIKKKNGGFTAPISERERIGLMAQALQAPTRLAQIISQRLYFLFTVAVSTSVPNTAAISASDSDAS
jgi:hypothetical protein